MTEPATAASVASLPHAVFLRRVATRPPTDPDVRLGQGAFLVLRLVDLLGPDRDPVAADAFRYQWAATERYCIELEVEGPEGVHLSGLVRAIHDAHHGQDFKLLAPAFLAYALFLEEEGHYEEAADVLDTLVQIGSSRLVAADLTAAFLRLGRVNRKVASFDAANAAYARAMEIASGAGDRFSVLLGRLGLAYVLHGKGNLLEAERSLRSVLTDAAAAGFPQAEALAEHGLATTLDARGQISEGIPHLWRAYELYEDDASRLRALQDLGNDFLALGDADSAERALKEVVRRCPQQDTELNALIELMNCASFRRDRLAFERRRQECDARVGDMPPNVLTDYCLKAGIGLARFGNWTKAKALMAEAIAIASRHGLHEFEFRIERIRDNLTATCEEGVPEEAGVKHNQAVREVSASLAAMAV